MRQFYASLFALIALGGVAACSDTSDEAIPPELRDPLIEQALGDHLMVDPNLASQNEANAALTVGYDSSIPPLISGPEQRDAALSAARTKLADSGKIAELPDPQEDNEWANLAGALSAAERASRIEFARECADRVSYSSRWAAELPDFAEPAPFGAVQEAAGNPSDKCNIRIVTYLTSLPVEEAIHFHYNLALRAEMTPAYIVAEESAILAVTPKASLAVHARKRDTHQTVVDIITREYAE